MPGGPPAPPACQHTSLAAAPPQAKAAAAATPVLPAQLAAAAAATAATATQTAKLRATLQPTLVRLLPSMRRKCAPASHGIAARVPTLPTTFHKCRRCSHSLSPTSRRREPQAARAATRLRGCVCALVTGYSSKRLKPQLELDDSLALSDGRCSGRAVAPAAATAMWLRCKGGGLVE